MLESLMVNKPLYSLSFLLFQVKVPYNEELVEMLIRVLELGYRNGEHQRSDLVPNFSFDVSHS